MIIRRAKDRFNSDHGWLRSWHTFSFAGHYDPAWSGFSDLLVLNDDRVAPGQGFGEHPHRDMEIISYVIEGELAHKDSIGNGGVIKAGELQYMSAGKGVRHSEMNPSSENEVHFLQIWIQPNSKRQEPRYSDFDTNKIKKENALVLFAADDKSDAPAKIRQNAQIYFGKLKSKESIDLKPKEGLPNHWLHLIKGKITLLGENFNKGDSCGFTTQAKDENIKIYAEADAEFLLFNLR